MRYEGPIRVGMVFKRDDGFREEAELTRVEFGRPGIIESIRAYWSPVRPTTPEGWALFLPANTDELPIISDPIQLRVGQVWALRVEGLTAVVEVLPVPKTRVLASNQPLSTITGTHDGTLVGPAAVLLFDAHERDEGRNRAFAAVRQRQVEVLKMIELGDIAASIPTDRAPMTMADYHYGFEMPEGAWAPAAQLRKVKAEPIGYFVDEIGGVSEVVSLPWKCSGTRAMTCATPHAPRHRGDLNEAITYYFKAKVDGCDPRPCVVCADRLIAMEMGKRAPTTEPSRTTFGGLPRLYSTAGLVGGMFDKGGNIL